MNQNSITGLPTRNLDDKATPKGFILTLIHALPNFYLDLVGNKPVKGNLNMDNHFINNVKKPTDSYQVANKHCVVSNYFRLDGATRMIGNIDISQKL